MLQPVEIDGQLAVALCPSYGRMGAKLGWSDVFPMDPQAFLNGNCVALMRSARFVPGLNELVHLSYSPSSHTQYSKTSRQLAERYRVKDGVLPHKDMWYYEYCRSAFGPTHYERELCCVSGVGLYPARVLEAKTKMDNS
jgi:hypothetical protein